jgi:hypothetical protein
MILQMLKDRWRKEEPREARLERLKNELRAMTDEERRRFIRRVWPDVSLASIGNKGKRKGGNGDG